MTENPYDTYLSENPTDLDRRVALLLKAIERSVVKLPHEAPNDANIRHMEAFFSFLKERFPADRFRADIQPIPRKSVRTTDRNFIVTVPGKSEQTLILVAHYDTWAFSRDAPGADDNTTGEEILKQYLLQDLSSADPPELTHIYLFSGSEECGTRGLISQFGLVIGLTLLASAFSSASLLYLLLALPFLPLFTYRFGITGTRHFVDTLSKEAKGAVRAAIAVDAVGEGRLYIMENEMGANFLRALFPYKGSEELNDLLEEGAHIHGIKYNRFLSGGTTDSVAFLEERHLPNRAKGKGRIPAAALLTMTPGKCSPLVWGGKLHTANDTPDRVYATPLKEALTVLDYAITVLEGGEAPSCPREIHEHHYARLYRDKDQWFVAMKDAVEPNRRNINSIFQVTGDMGGNPVEVEAGELAWWGVETKLEKEMKDFRPGARPVRVKTLKIRDGETWVSFEAPTGIRRKLSAWRSGLVGAFEHLIGRYSFLSMFVTALLVSLLSTKLLDGLMMLFPPFGFFVGRHYLWVFFAMLVIQLAALYRLISRELPTWMDNAYRHENRADNLQSLRRTRSR